VEIVQGLSDLSIGEGIAEDLRNHRYIYGQNVRNIDHLVVPGCKVLVVDDVQANIIVALGLLKPYGLSVDTAKSGQEAITKIKAGYYDLVFMDHMMPDMDGVQTVAVIRELGIQVPIIAMTANAMHGMKEFYLGNGFQGFISKPVSPQALNDILKIWLRHQDKSEQYADNFLPDNFALVMLAHHLDILNHYRIAFMETQSNDFGSDYYLRFIKLLKSLIADDLPAGLIEQAESLIIAGEEEDVKKVRQLLPIFYEGLINQLTIKTEARADVSLADGKSQGDIMQRLKHAISTGETQAAGKIMTELRTLHLNHSERELYFLLNDLLLEGESEKAIEAIENFYNIS
jgi:CheY-like chemotaxis protein